MENQIFEIGGLYAFDYEKDRTTDPNFVWWECIEIREGWAILYRMSKDHKGDPRPSTTPIEVTYKGMIKGPKLHTYYLDEFVTDGIFLKARILECEKDSTAYKVSFDDNDKKRKYFHIFQK